MTSSVNGAERRVLAKLIPDADVGQVQAALETGGFVVQISEQPKQIAEGETRNNPDTGLAEVFTNGTLVAAIVVEPVIATTQELAQCQAATDAILAKSTVMFLPNSDELDATGDGVVAQLVQAMLPCATGILRAEIGGHTDTSGDADKNLTLSQLRADRVRAALINAGLPDGMLTAKGYGSAQPISENETAEGRAKNRRTTVSWTQ
jgi:OOP family OmpA-OmpF porin